MTTMILKFWRCVMQQEANWLTPNPVAFAVRALLTDCSRPLLPPGIYFGIHAALCIFLPILYPEDISFSSTLLFTSLSHWPLPAS
jgi:hypothetical protein